MKVNYPKSIMKKNELMGMGFPEEYLMRVYRSPAQNFAHKMNPTKINSPIIFETKAFEDFRQKQIAAEVKSMPRGI